MQGNQPCPLRIEMATSEIEGGELLSWADPAQVIACVVASHPPDAFRRHLEPLLADLDREENEEAQAGADRLPARVQNLLQRLREVHGRLYRENRSGGGDPASLRIVAAVVEENRIFFIKGIPCWIYRVRAGAAHPECLGEADREALRDAPGLGLSGTLRLQVTSLEVNPEDLILLLVAREGEAPDHRSVTQVFRDTRDLKRACDGLMNLIALQSEGGGSIAVRFVPVGAGGRQQAETSRAFEDLERELATEIRGGRFEETAPPRPDGSPAFGTVEREEVPLPRFLEEVPEPGGPPLRPERQAAGSSAGEPQRPEPPPHRAEPAPQLDAAEPLRAPRVPAPPPPPPDRGATAFDRRPPPERRNAIWVFSFGIVLALLLAVIAIPRGLVPWPGGRGGQEGEGVLRIDSDPPARSIRIDGVAMGVGSPAVLEGIAAGTRRVGLDLGAFGTIEREVVVRAGETVDLRPAIQGAIEIDATLARPGARAWLKGREARLVPCRFDELPVGFWNVFYEDEHLPLWQREILVRAGQTATLRVPNAVASDRALLRIESWIYREGEGLTEALGDTVWIDGERSGRSPWEVEVAPGLHGIRVRSAGGQQWTEVVEMTPGASRVVAPRFGMDAWPEIRHQGPGRLLLTGPVPLAATILPPPGESVRNPRIHLPELDAAVRDLPLTPIDSEEGAFIAFVDPGWIPIGRPVAYYFSVQTSSGKTLCSDLYRFTASSELSLGLSGL